MAVVVWSDSGLRDLARLHGFLADQNRPAAMQAVRAIRKSVRMLRAHPAIGRTVEDMPAGFRELVVPFGRSAYVLRYRLRAERVVILALRHAREAGF